jgi:hypothetical protein
MTTDLDDLAHAMDGVQATGNLAMAAIKVRYRATILSQDNEHVVAMIPTPEWVDLVEQISMFVAVAQHFKEMEEGTDDTSI